jgi:hypothetical protein
MDSMQQKYQSQFYKNRLSNVSDPKAGGYKKSMAPIELRQDEEENSGP